jgi:hypothetical protein
LPRAERPATSTNDAWAPLLQQLQESEANCTKLECNLQQSRQEHEHEVAYLRKELQSLEAKLPKPGLSQIERTKAGSGNGAASSGSSGSAGGAGSDSTASPSVGDRMAAAAGALASPFGTLGLGSGSILGRSSSSGSTASTDSSATAVNQQSTPVRQVRNGTADAEAGGAAAGAETKADTSSAGSVWAGLGALGNTLRQQSPNPLSGLGALMGRSDSTAAPLTVDTNADATAAGAASAAGAAGAADGAGGERGVSPSVKTLAEKTMELLDSPLPSGVQHPASPPRGSHSQGNDGANEDNAPGTPPPEQQLEAEMGAYETMGSPDGLADTPPTSPARADQPEI